MHEAIMMLLLTYLNLNDIQDYLTVVFSWIQQPT